MAPGKGDRLWLWPLLSAALLGGAWILPNSRALRATACELLRASGPAAAAGGDTMHVLYTSNGSPYLNYQTLALYGSFRMAQRMRPGGDKLLALTRILHRSEDDELSPYVPTFRAQPLHPECDGGKHGPCRYPVADRANSLRQFLEAAERDPAMIKAPWLYLIECDYLFVRPVAAPGPADGSARPLAFHYSYIFPEAKVLKNILPRLYPPGLGNLSDIPRTGPAPVMARLAEWRRVLPRWEGLTAQIENDPEAVKALDWVREMYAFAIACAVERLDLELMHPNNGTLIIQPPADLRLNNATQIHYTWGPKLVWSNNGTIHWRFEKRDHMAVDLDNLPFVPLPPPWADGRYKTPSGRVGPQGAPTSLEDYNLIKFEAQLFNNGLKEMGGRRWKEVLGAEAAAARATGSESGGGG